MTPLHGSIARYYANRLSRHGATPAGVDWRDEASQWTRFEQLCKVIKLPGGSVVDLGCGYGAMLDFLRGQGFSGAYCGLDVASQMIEAAIARHKTDTHARFEVGSKPSGPAGYVIASGIFNVRQDCSNEEWRHYIADTLDDMDRGSEKGFAFNCLTSYSDPERMREDLFYGDPGYYFDLCKRLYSYQVALLHDYGLFEFTIIVRKE